MKHDLHRPVYDKEPLAYASHRKEILSRNHLAWNTAADGVP